MRSEKRIALKLSTPQMFLIWANPGHFLVYFRPFLIPISIPISTIKIEWCAWDSNPGRWMLSVDETTELWRPRHPIRFKSNDWWHIGAFRAVQNFYLIYVLYFLKDLPFRKIDTVKKDQIFTINWSWMASNPQISHIRSDRSANCATDT